MLILFPLFQIYPILQGCRSLFPRPSVVLYSVHFFVGQTIAYQYLLQNLVKMNNINDIVSLLRTQFSVSLYTPYICLVLLMKLFFCQDALVCSTIGSQSRLDYKIFVIHTCINKFYLHYCSILHNNCRQYLILLFK